MREFWTCSLLEASLICLFCFLMAAAILSPFMRGSLLDGLRMLCVENAPLTLALAAPTWAWSAFPGI